MQTINLPIEFAGCKTDYVNKVNSNEYSGSCPQCGGVPHKGGASPDRFRMFLNAHGKNKVMGWCRRCGYTWFPNNDNPMSPADFAEWKRNQIEVEEARKRSAQKAIDLLMSEKVWFNYHSALNDWSRDVIKSWGIRQDYVNYWKLGLIDDYTVFSGDDQYHSPAISIPVWQYDFKVSNVKVRVLNPQNPHDRYRSLYKTGSAMPFVAWPALKANTCFLVEGEKKAMVAAQHIDQTMQVIGVPTKTPGDECLPLFEGFEKIYLCLDPDAREEDKKGASALGRLKKMLGVDRVLDVMLPAKVDDMITRNSLDRVGLLHAMRYATGGL